MTSANVPSTSSAPARVDFQQKSNSEVDWKKLTPKDVADLHRKADTDLRAEALHHTLGLGRNQAFPGDAWKRILNGITLTGSKATYNPAREAQIVSALKALGAIDSTT